MDHKVLHVIVKSLDNIDVDSTHCDAGHPPGSPERSLILNVTAVWCTPTGGMWIKSFERSAMKTAELVKHHTAKDLISILSGKEIVHEGSETGSDGGSPEDAPKLQSLQGHSTGDADEQPAGES